MAMYTKDARLLPTPSSSSFSSSPSSSSFTGSFLFPPTYCSENEGSSGLGELPLAMIVYITFCLCSKCGFRAITCGWTAVYLSGIYNDDHDPGEHYPYDLHDPRTHIYLVC
ncbi:hypothetical protein E2C01_001043 [Portunus trituberculatus]|uniref:Uncharacterized protein n=1 Tax=Portunus trituberculatus TaxID=210409 RepID=A0A5B7CJ87_PORTR|nr:hypothetical protein [Portunus trituberculatus]